SLRCFFFAMRLRRFLMTEPMFTSFVRIADYRDLNGSAGSLTGRFYQAPRRPGLRDASPLRAALLSQLGPKVAEERPRSGRVSKPPSREVSAGLHVGVGDADHAGDRGLRDAVGAPEAHGRQLARMHEAVDGHRGDAH